MALNKLYHTGIKGMHWGERRYQNADGSLTDEGRKRYAKEAKENGWTQNKDGEYVNKKNKVQNPNANKWVKDDLNRHKRLSDSSKQLTNELRNMNKNTMERAKKNKTRLDLSNMTDKEIRDKINRELVERQYNDIFNPAKVSKGRERADRFLEVAGGLLGTTSSVLAIALAVKELKG